MKEQEKASYRLERNKQLLRLQNPLQTRIKKTEFNGYHKAMLFFILEHDVSNCYIQVPCNNAYY